MKTEFRKILKCCTVEDGLINFAFVVAMCAIILIAALGAGFLLYSRFGV